MSYDLGGMAANIRMKRGPGDRAVFARWRLFMAYCDEAADNGRVPDDFVGKTSNARLAAKCEMDEATVKRMKAQLVDDGWLIPDGSARAGRGRAARYRVNVRHLRERYMAARAEHEAEVRAREAARRADPEAVAGELARSEGMGPGSGSGTGPDRPDSRPSSPNSERGANCTRFQSQAAENTPETGERGADSAAFEKQVSPAPTNAVSGDEKQVHLVGKVGAFSAPNPINPTPPIVPPVPVSGARPPACAAGDDARRPVGLAAASAAGAPDGAAAVSGGDRAATICPASGEWSGGDAGQGQAGNPSGAAEGSVCSAGSEGGAAGGRSATGIAPEAAWPALRRELVARGAKFAASARAVGAVLVCANRWDRGAMVDGFGARLAAAGFIAVMADGDRPFQAIALPGADMGPDGDEAVRRKMARGGEDGPQARKGDRPSAAQRGSTKRSAGAQAT